MLEREIEAFEANKVELEREHLGKWVVFQGSSHEGTYDTFEQAAENAVDRFGRGPFLIRQIGERELVLSASVMHYPARAEGN